MQTVDAADYRDIAKPLDPRVAPDGDRVAFVRRVPADDEDDDATIYVVSTGGSDPRRFTVAEGRDSEPRWSPSGDRLAFVSTRGAADDRPQLWVLPTDGGEARQVTNVAGGVSNVAWSPDGTRIAFIQRASAEDREEGRDVEVPDDFEPEDPDPRVIDRTVYRSAQRYFDGARSHVYVVTLGDDTTDGSDAVERLTDGDADFASPTWGDASTLYYAERVGEDPDDSIEFEILAHDRSGNDSGGDGSAGDDGGGDGHDGTDAETIHRTTGWTPDLAATADGRVAYRYDDADRLTLGLTELRVFDRDSGTVTEPTAALDRTLAADVRVQWGPNDEWLYFATPDEGRVPVWRARWDGGDGRTAGGGGSGTTAGDGDGGTAWDGDGTGDGVDEADHPPQRVVDDGHVAGAHVGTDLVAFVQSEWDHPGDVFVATKGGGETNRLTRLNSAYLDDRAVAQPEPVRFDGEGPDPIQGWVLAPPEFGGPDQSGGEERYPLAVAVHGGPHGMWSTAGTMWHEFQTLAARGYVVFWCNPRGSTGYGEEFAAAIERDWGDVTMADVMAGVREVADRDYVDADQLFLTGGSFGGFATSWMVGHTDEFAAAVTQRGVHDLTGFYGSTDAAYKLVEGDFATTPWDEPGFLHEQSPIAYCDRVATPTLVVHSDEDYRTPANTAELFYRGLRKHDVETRMVRYPREGHELSRSGEPGHVVDRIERIVRWFDGYSAHHDVPRALDRADDAGLSAGDGDESAESSPEDGE